MSMTHAPETGAINWLHFSVTGFWYMCYSDLWLDSSVTRFRCRLECCSIPSQKVACTWLKWSFIIYFFFNLPLFTIPAIIIAAALVNYIFYVAFSHVYFWHQKFSFLMYMVQKTGPQNGVDLWRRFLEHVSWVLGSLSCISCRILNFKIYYSVVAIVKVLEHYSSVVVVIVKVLEQESVGRVKKVKYNSLLPGEDNPVSESGILVHEKRTRFSLSHDQDSIGEQMSISLSADKSLNQQCIHFVSKKCTNFETV